MNKHKLLICCFVALLGILPPAIAVDVAPAGGDVKESRNFEIDNKKIDAIFSHVDAAGPGGIITVANNGKIIFQKSYGLADIETKAPITATTVFELASCSKQFTAAAVLLLCECGKISLDDDICKYFPELAQKNPKGRTMLVRDLLGMRSGLPDYSVGMSEDEINSSKPEEVLQWTAEHSRKFKPGEKYDYNNGNYSLTALLVARVAKEKFADFMKREIFDPAGMTHSFVMTTPDMKIANRAGGYKESKKGFTWSRQDTYIPGDGQVMTTADDFVLWDKALRDGKILKPESLAAAWANGTLNNGKNTGYGLGWSVETRDGHSLVDHEGSWAGTSTYILHYLDSGLTVIVLSNNEDFNAGTVGAQVADVVLN